MFKLIIFDFDGVFTDGNIIFDNNSNPLKHYNAKDGMGIFQLHEKEIPIGVISGWRYNPSQEAILNHLKIKRISLGSNKKLTILKEWCEELNIELKDVAYMGDDINDLEVMKEVGFVACPNDAVTEVKEIADFISNKPGGNGAIREFCDFILHENFFEKNVKNDGKITAVIPVRKGSTRCKKKNIRNFGDTNLLKLKIETLKKVKSIDEIIVSTDCEDMKNLSKELNVKVHERDAYFASSECPNYEYWSNLSMNVGECDNLMMVNCVSPLITEQIIEQFVEKFNKNSFKNMITVTEYKKFFYFNSNETVNFDKNKTPNSQLLRPIYEVTYGLSICNRQDIINSKCIYGNNPEFFILDNVTGIDIDVCSEFLISEFFYQSHIFNSKIANFIIKNRIDNCKKCDCTIRDGGYLNNWNFSNQQIIDCYKAVSELGIDYFEIGFRSNMDLLKDKGKWCYSTDVDIDEIVSLYKGTKICVMAKLGTVTIEDFSEKEKSNVDLVRVLVPRISIENGKKISKYNRYDIIESKKFCLELIDLGYKITLNLGCGDLIEKDELEMIVREINDIPLESIYLADTYGGFNEKNLPLQIHRFYMELEKYSSRIPIGIHIHNNNGNALQKVKISEYHGCQMIDMSIGGMGRGTGNLKTEEYICEKYKNDNLVLKEKMMVLMEYYDLYIQSKKDYNKNVIQQHPYYNIAGSLSLHPDYILEILLDEKSSIENDIEKIFQLHEYTIKNNFRNYDKELLSIL